MHTHSVHRAARLTRTGSGAGDEGRGARSRRRLHTAGDADVRHGQVGEGTARRGVHAEAEGELDDPGAADQDARVPRTSARLLLGEVCKCWRCYSCVSVC